MKIVTIGVSSRAEVKRSLSAAFRGERQPPRIGFASAELLMRTLTEHRIQMLRVMCGAGPLGLRELARKLDRDVKRVHGDAHALLKTGVLRKAKDRKLEFPYDVIHVEFELWIQPVAATDWR